jgi:RNA polymerase sigma-70 factor (ECF subfamily)
VPRLDPQSLGQHLNALYRGAWALCGSREDAEDLVQETFARVLAKPRVIRGDERAYLMQTMRNTFYSRVRTASRRPQTAATLEDVDPVDPRPGLQPDRAVEFGELLAAIAELPEDFRLAIVAVDIIGLSYQEAARVLETREATITTRVYRARQRVVRRISEPPAAEPHVREEKPPGRGLV